MNKFSIFALIFFLLSFLPWCTPGSFLSADTIIDTLYSIPYLDGGILYNWDNHTYSSNSSDTYFSCGDYAFIIFGTGRGYLSFELSDIPEDYELQNAEIFVEQFYSVGNDNGGQFPICNIYPPPDTTGCIVDHINYGNQLDVGDWTAGDPGDSQTLHSNIGVISDNASYEFKNQVVTSKVQEDYDTGRDKTQYRLRFLVNNDWDQYADLLRFASGNAYLYECPYIVYTWWDGQNGIENNQISIIDERLNAYPNPFNGEVNIVYSMNYSSNNLEIYNIRGQKVYSQMNLPVAGSIVWKCEDQTSGIYLIRISNSKQKYVKQITYLK